MEINMQDKWWCVCTHDNEVFRFDNETEARHALMGRPATDMFGSPVELNPRHITSFYRTGVPEILEEQEFHECIKRLSEKPEWERE